MNQPSNLPHLPPNPAATPERLSLIARAMLKLRAKVKPAVKRKPVILFVPIVARVEDIEEEAQLAGAHREEDTIIDVEVNVSIPSVQLVARLADAERLTDDRHEARTALVHHDSDILSKRERKQAADDLFAYRNRYTLALPTPRRALILCRFVQLIARLAA